MLHGTHDSVSFCESSLVALFLSSQEDAQPPCPALGGAVLQRCGLVSFHTASRTANAPADLPSASTAAQPQPPQSGRISQAMTNQPSADTAAHLWGSIAADFLQPAQAGSARPAAAEQAVAASQPQPDPAQALHLRGVAERPAVAAKPKGHGLEPKQAVAECRLEWRVKLRECVDASPLILIQLAPCADALHDKDYR